jgi:ATP adenylyltransferase
MPYIESAKNEEGCVFCAVQTEPDKIENLVVFVGVQCFVILNRYPYTSGHLMVVPKVHVPSLEALVSETRGEVMELAAQAIQVLNAVYQPQGFNLGINMGEAAGAGITEHIHLHIVPRWVGDTNFMSTLGQTRVLPELLEDTYQRVKGGWSNMVRNG